MGKNKIIKQNVPYNHTVNPHTQNQITDTKI